MWNNEFWYTLNELLEDSRETATDTLGFASLIYYIDEFHGHAGATGIFEMTLKEIGLDLSDLKIKFSDGSVSPTNLGKLMTLIKMRYGNNYVGKCNSDGRFYLSETRTLPDFIKSEDAYYFAEKFIAIIVMSYEKYNKILNIYIAQENKLMDGLKSTRETSSSLDRAHSDNASHDETKTDDYTIEANGKNLHNNTPETTDVVATLEGNQHVSDLDKSHAETSNEGSTEIHGVDAHSGEVHDAASGNEEAVIDSKYVMEKIAEIQDSYQETLRRWSDEFAGLFIEEGNIVW